ncbi:MAG: anti-sigma F factor [Butyricicoccaceae bacterium]
MTRRQINQMSLKFESRSNNESFARQTVAAFAAQLDPTIDELNDIKTAVSEAVTNCIVHAYRDRMGYITVTVRLYDTNEVQITVKDKGCGIPDVKQAMQPMFTTGDSERSGMGFTIMESFMDKLRITSRKDTGTLVTMTKRISVRPKRDG